MLTSSHSTTAFGQLLSFADAFRTTWIEVCVSLWATRCCNMMIVSHSYTVACRRAWLSFKTTANWLRITFAGRRNRRECACTFFPIYPRRKKSDFSVGQRPNVDSRLMVHRWLFDSESFALANWICWLTNRTVGHQFHCAQTLGPSTLQRCILFYR